MKHTGSVFNQPPRLTLGIERENAKAMRESTLVTCTHPRIRSTPHLNVWFKAGLHDWARAPLLKGSSES